MTRSKERVVFAFLFVLAVVGSSAQKSVAMNCSECIKQCASGIGIGVKVASTLDLGVSFASNISRTIYEDQPAAKGIRKIFRPLAWIENKWMRVAAYVFLVFPAINIFYSKYELLFTWLGAIPPCLLAFSTIGDGVGYLLAKKGCYRSQWKAEAANRLVDEHQQAAADWVNSLP